MLLRGHNMTKKLTTCSLMAVLGILCLLVSNILQTNTVFLYLFSTLFVYICTEQHGIKYGLLTYAVISLAGFILVANKISIIAYAMVVGYYPVVKHIAEHFNINKPLKWILKITFAIAVSTLAFFVLKSFTAFNLNIGITYALGIFVFVVYDIALTMGIKYYALKFTRLK